MRCAMRRVSLFVRYMPRWRSHFCFLQAPSRDIHRSMMQKKKVIEKIAQTRVWHADKLQPDVRGWSGAKMAAAAAAAADEPRL